MAWDAQAAWHGLAFTLGLALLVWLGSLWRHDLSLVDRFWPALIGGAGLAAALSLDGGPSPRGLLMLMLAALWGLRLGLYITRRNWGRGEDARYTRLRARNGPLYPYTSLLWIFGLQALLAWIVAAPLLAGAVSRAPLQALDVAGALLCGAGLLIEAIADAQMARFRRDPARRGTVMDRGLWAWSRHPNYFGETCFWWGLGLIALAGSGWSGAWSLISPLLMTVLLLKVSGVALLERELVERRPAYRDYIDRTSAFVPWPPRRAPGPDTASRHSWTPPGSRP